MYQRALFVSGNTPVSETITDDGVYALRQGLLRE
jgi:hypothetical protein